MAILLVNVVTAVNRDPLYCGKMQANAVDAAANIVVMLWRFLKPLCCDCDCNCGLQFRILL